MLKSPQLQLLIMNSLDKQPTLFADDIVIATGVCSEGLVRILDEKAYLESERGYNTTIADAGVKLSREAIFAEKKFVVTPLTCGLRIGGTAQFGGINNPANFKRVAILTTLAKNSYLNCIRLLDLIGNVVNSAAKVVSRGRLDDDRQAAGIKEDHV